MTVSPMVQGIYRLTVTLTPNFLADADETIAPVHAAHTAALVMAALDDPQLHPEVTNLAFTQVEPRALTFVLDVHAPGPAQARRAARAVEAIAVEAPLDISVALATISRPFVAGDSAVDLPAGAYDEDGFAPDGFDELGYDVDGYDRQGYDEAGFDRDGVDQYGSRLSDA